MAKFKRGKSGNPKGKPKGSPDKRTAYRELLSERAPELVDMLVKNALEGDTAALRICIDRLIPPMRAVDGTIKLDVSGPSLTAKGDAVLKAMGEGMLTPDQAATLLQAIGAQARIVEIDELEKRLSALEAKNENKSLKGKRP